MIVIIDYGMGNVGSIANMLKKVGAKAEISSAPESVSSAEKLILPGVGAFDAGMSQLEERRLIEPLNQLVIKEKIPLLGICLGMQLLSRSSEEGTRPGLGWIDARTVKFRVSPTLRLPHMGWNSVSTRPNTKLFQGGEEKKRFYFVHSFHLELARKEDESCSSIYGYEFPSAIEHENIFGTQFHPEKSHHYGLEVFRNFIRL